MESKIILDEVEMNQDEFEKKLEEAKSNPNVIIKEVSNGVFKTLERLQG